jgi:uncharacterized protein (TIGR02145 family)
MKEYGSMTDKGGKTYKTVVIGTQTWMAANLNYNLNTGKHKCYAQGKGNGEDEWLRPEDPQVQANCDKYGRLYDWATAMDIPASCNNNSCPTQIKNPHQGICPSGWHIPSNNDWETLKDFTYEEMWNNFEDEDFGWDVGTKLKAIINANSWKDVSAISNPNDTVGVRGVDSYGFGAIGSGYCVSCESLSDGSGYYAAEKEEAHWWSATEYINPYNNDATQAYKYEVTYNKKVMNRKSEKKVDYLYSIRCVKD